MSARKKSSEKPLHQVPRLTREALGVYIPRVLQHAGVADNVRQEVIDVLREDGAPCEVFSEGVVNRQEFCAVMENILSMSVSPEIQEGLRSLLHIFLKQLADASREEILFILAKDALTKALLDLFTALQGKPDGLESVSATLEKATLLRIGEIEEFYVQVRKIHDLAQEVRGEFIPNMQRFRTRIYKQVREASASLDDAGWYALSDHTLAIAHMGYLRQVSNTIRPGHCHVAPQPVRARKRRCD